MAKVLLLNTTSVYVPYIFVKFSRAEERMSILECLWNMELTVFLCIYKII